MFTRIIFAGLFITLLVCCGKTVPENSLPKNNCKDDLIIDEIKITSMVASELLKPNFLEGKTSIIINTTLINHSQKDVTETLKASSEKLLSNETVIIEDFESKNKVPLSFDKGLLILSHKYEFISPDEFAEISKINPYMEKSDPLQKQFPNSTGVTGIVGFSRIGFNKDFSKAIIYAFRWYDHGSFFLLEKENCEWQIKKEQQIWMH